MKQQRAAAFGRRHPRLTGLLGLPLWLPGLLFGWFRVEGTPGAAVILAVAGSVGLAFTVLLLLRGHRLPRWASIVFFTYCVAAALVVGRRGSGTGPVAGAAAFSISTFLTTMSLALVAGFRRVAPGEEADD